MTNGYDDIYFWHVGQVSRRLVHGFLSPTDLDNLLYLRQNQPPPGQAPINNGITDRTYQLETSRGVALAVEFEYGERSRRL